MLSYKSEYRIKYTNKQNDISLIHKVCIFHTTFPTYMNFSNTASDDKEWNASAAATPPLAVSYQGPPTKCQLIRDTHPIPDSLVRGPLLRSFCCGEWS